MPTPAGFHVLAIRFHNIFWSYFHLQFLWQERRLALMSALLTWSLSRMELRI